MATQQQNFPTPQQQQFYQLQQQQAMQQAMAMHQAAQGSAVMQQQIPPQQQAFNQQHQQQAGGFAAPMGLEQGMPLPQQSIPYQGNYGQMSLNAMNGSMGEVPYSSNMMMQQQQQQLNLNPGAQPFVSGSGPVMGMHAHQSAPGSLEREGSMGSNGSGTPTTPLTPGGSKRRHNPYAQIAVAEPGDGQNPATISPVGMAPHSTNSPAQQNLNQSWGSAPGGFAGQNSFSSPVAAPLPTSLPQREGNIKGHRGQKGHHRDNNNNNQQGHPQQGGNNGQPVSHEEVLSQVGTYVELARTANGSSFIQAAVREGSDPANLETIWAELSPCLSDLFLDAHGCYVIKSVMERLPPAQLNDAVAVMANDPQLVFSMCTHSLHTRRVVQFLLDSMDCPFIFQLLTTHCAEIAMTQQGCIVMQRAMDTAQGQAKLDLYNAIYANLLRFCTDPFANYVVQHMLEVGDKAANSAVFRHQFLGHVIQLSCNKFASNVMEKALFHLDEQLQHELLVGIYDSGEETLYRMLQDSFGNYLIQSSIALAQYKDVFFISEKLRPVLQRTPYGHKIEGRLDRRLKGKAVGTRSPMIGATFKANTTGTPQQGGNQQQPQQQHGGGGRGRGGNRQQRPHSQQSADSLDGSDDVVEEPW